VLILAGTAALLPGSQAAVAWEPGGQRRRWPAPYYIGPDRLVIDVIDRVPGLASSAGHVRQLMTDKRISCRAYTREHGEDAPRDQRLEVGVTKSGCSSQVAWRRWRKVTAESSAAAASSAADRYSAACSALVKAAYPAWMIWSSGPFPVEPWPRDTEPVSIT
jgi:hypothetical protein